MKEASWWHLRVFYATPCRKRQGQHANLAVLDCASELIRYCGDANEGATPSRAASVFLGRAENTEAGIGD